MSGPGNPLDAANKASSAAAISSIVYPIAGILTTVYGLDELPQNVQEIACLWLLHPRLQTQASMAPLAAQAIHHWNSKRGGRSKGLIAVSFDQRNHGSRQIDKMANEAWRQGNARHAQDMFSVYQGTAQDTSLLLTHLPSYLPHHLPIPRQNLALGISLGGHSVWHCLLSDPRITTGVVIIGCPDFTRLMCQRAEKSRLKTWGSNFIGSPDFPPALVNAIVVSDPAGLLLPFEYKAPRNLQADEILEPTSNAKAQHAKVLDVTLKNKNILNLSGGADKLVPYSMSEPFLRFLKRAISPEGWWGDNGLVLDDRIFEGVGHESTPAMNAAAVSFITDALAGDVGRKGVRESRI
ncbi:hypothetical protein EJ08DRAFT_604289 [Tothia fuscella]|uniref:Uncharacterized protein n=1 Tax=Tothia fuscella TaxID=1048955 RepID=A0A9P4NZK0_9PEZI|nr:hypothetical protein EJ08DRAFT_604289 [Tothia fuscella]